MPPPPLYILLSGELARLQLSVETAFSGVKPASSGPIKLRGGGAGVAGRPQPPSRSLPRPMLSGRRGGACCLSSSLRTPSWKSGRSGALGRPSQRLPSISVPSDFRGGTSVRHESIKTQTSPGAKPWEARRRPRPAQSKPNRAKPNAAPRIGESTKRS